MKQYSIYICEKCRRESRDANNIMACEAAHLGLSAEEKLMYDVLKEVTAHCGIAASTTKNDKTEKAFDEAIRELLAFEREHNINL